MTSFFDFFLRESIIFEHGKNAQDLSYYGQVLDNSTNLLLFVTYCVIK